MDRDEVIQNLYGIKSYLVAKSCEKSNIPKEALEITKAAFTESIKTIDCTIDMLKNREFQEKCPCQGCHNCMCDDYRIWAGLPEPT